MSEHGWLTKFAHNNLNLEAVGNVSMRRGVLDRPLWVRWHYHDGQC